MIFAWFCPPKYFSKVHRGKLLTILDTFGKWSQVDLYVLVLLMVSFNIQVKSPVELDGNIPEGFLSMHMQLDPQWGLYGFVIAVMGCIFTNQVIVWYNRESIRAVLELQHKRRESGDYNPNPTKRLEGLFAHHFETRDGMEFIQYGFGGVLIVALLILLCLGFVIWGSLASSLGYEYKGLISAGLEWSKVNGSVPRYSIVTMTDLIKNQDGINVYGLLFLQISIYFFTLIAPIIYICILLWMFVARMTVTGQEKMLLKAEIVKDWCCLDVYVVAYVVTLLEVGHLADFISGGAAPICNFINQLVINGDDLGCFSMDAFPVNPGIPVIITSVILLWIIQKIIIGGTQEAVHDREPEEHFERGHKPSSAFMDLVLEREKPSPGIIIGKLLPDIIVKVGRVAISSDGERRYTCTAGTYVHTLCSNKIFFISLET